MNFKTKLLQKDYVEVWLVLKYSFSNDLSYKDQWNSDFFKFIFLSFIVNLILRINDFATLGDKIKNKLRKVDFT